MSSVKTAVSLDKSLFDQVEGIAGEMNVSRSRVFSLALEEFIRRHENRRLLEHINEAYADGPEEAETDRLRRMSASHRRIVEGEW